MASISNDGQIFPAVSVVIWMLRHVRILCQVPASPTVGALGVTISLNNGTSGTFSADEKPFQHYAPPYVSSISPSEGNAPGGTIVNVTGSGFTGLLDNGLRGAAAHED